MKHTITLSTTIASMLYSECQQSVKARKNVIEKYSEELKRLKKLKRPNLLTVARCQWYIETANEHLPEWERAAKALRKTLSKTIR
jgi:hypothetical protein